MQGSLTAIKRSWQQAVFSRQLKAKNKKRPLCRSRKKVSSFVAN